MIYSGTNKILAPNNCETGSGQPSVCFQGRILLSATPAEIIQRRKPSHANKAMPPAPHARREPPGQGSGPTMKRLQRKRRGPRRCRGQSGTETNPSCRGNNALCCQCLLHKQNTILGTVCLLSPNQHFTLWSFPNWEFVPYSNISNLISIFPRKMALYALAHIPSHRGHVTLVSAFYLFFCFNTLYF